MILSFIYFSFLFCFRTFECRMYELLFRNVYVDFLNALSIDSFKKHFEKTDNDQARLRHGYNKILQKIYG